MDWQETTALAIVAMTAGLFLRARWGAGKRSGGCGCPGSQGGPGEGRIIFRAKRGERSQIVVRPPGTDATGAGRD